MKSSLKNSGVPTPSVKVHRLQDHRFREMCTFEINQLSTSGRRSAKHILWTCPQPNAMAAPKVCDTTELQEYVFWPLSCDAYDQVQIVSFGDAGPVGSADKIHEINRSTDIVHIGQ